MPDLNRIVAVLRSTMKAQDGADMASNFSVPTDDANFQASSYLIARYTASNISPRKPVLLQSKFQNVFGCLIGRAKGHL